MVLSLPLPATVNKWPSCGNWKHNKQNGKEEEEEAEEKVILPHTSTSTSTSSARPQQVHAALLNKN